MREPTWNRLPFLTDPADWRCYAETQTAVETLEFIQGTFAPGSAVWLEVAAMEAFANRADCVRAAAFLALGGGVLRWYRAMPIAEGEYHEARFHGAPGLLLHIGRLGDCLFVFLPK